MVSPIACFTDRSRSITAEGGAAAVLVRLVMIGDIDIALQRQAAVTSHSSRAEMEVSGKSRACTEACLNAASDSTDKDYLKDLGRRVRPSMQWVPRG